MRVIWKFPLKLTNEVQEIQIPDTHCFLHAGMQSELFCAWFEVEDDRPLVKRAFRIFGTGHEIPEEQKHFYAYMRTTQDDGFVWHLYELEPKP